MTQHTRDTIKKDFDSFIPNSCVDCKHIYKGECKSDFCPRKCSIADYFLSKFDTLLEEKVARIESAKKEMMTYDSNRITFAEYEGFERHNATVVEFNEALDTALAIIKKE